MQSNHQIFFLFLYFKKIFCYLKLLIYPILKKYTDFTEFLKKNIFLTDLKNLIKIFYFIKY